MSSITNAMEARKMISSMSTSSPLVSDDEALTKKATPRKGTISCRECKRRKVRCFYSSTTDSVCVGCRRRGTPCQSQEVGDEATGNEGDFSLRGRLIKLEALVERIVQRMDAEDIERKDKVVTARNPQAYAATPGLQSSADCSENAPHRGNNEKTSKKFDPSAGSRIRETVTAQNSRASSSRETRDKFTKIQHTLHAAMPSQEVTNVLFGGDRASVYLHILCNSQRAVSQGNLQPSSSLSVLPGKSSHPVLLARKLLQIAICFQQFCPSLDNTLLNMTESPRDIMARYLDLASSLVTSNDELIGSLEGMECLVLEGVYLINSGNLRRAWLTVRRAMSVAQLMGLQRRTPSTLKVLDSTTRASCSAIWARIVYAERYLSLLLGAPSSIADNTFASEENMIGATSTERLDKVHAVVSGLIIERNQKGSPHEFKSTQEIHFYLQKASASVPPKWWLMPDLNQEMGALELAANMLKAQSQIVHHNLLIILHLPRLLRSPSEPACDYSKTACASASREVLTRFISFRTSIKIASCCRLIDFCAFTAGLTTLLAHMTSDGRPGGNLAHQMLSDRELVERAMDTMDELNRVSGDTLSRKTVEVTRKLLAMMRSSSSNLPDIYDIRSMDAETDTGYDENCFRLKIPYFGTISIARRELVRAQPYPPRDAPYISSSYDTHIDLPSLPSSLPSGLESLHSGSRVGQQNLDWDATVSQHGGPLNTQGLAYPSVYLHGDLQGHNHDLAMPDFIAEADDWAFQGLDKTFFDALLNADKVNENTWAENWSNWDTLS